MTPHMRTISPWKNDFPPEIHCFPLKVLWFSIHKMDYNISFIHWITIKVFRVFIIK